LVLDFKNAFKIAEKYHADPANAGEDSIDFTKSTNWRRREDLDHVGRTSVSVKWVKLKHIVY